ARRQRAGGERVRPRETARPCDRGPHALDRSTRANAAATAPCGAGCGRATSQGLSALIRSASDTRSGPRRAKKNVRRPAADLTGGTPMKLRHGTQLAFLALTVSLFAAGCGGGGKDELVIGEYGSLTGGDAKLGVEVAMAELTSEAQGKIGGLPVRVVVEDDQSQAQEAATAVQKLVNQDQAIAVIGEVASSRSLAGGPICQAAGVPMISPSSTNPKVTQVGNFIFRMCFLDDFQGRSVAQFA